MSFLYKTSGLVVEIDDDPANPNQPRQPSRVVPRPGGSFFDPFIDIPSPSPTGETSVGSDTPPPSPRSGRSPWGPGGNYVFLSSFVGSGGGRKIPPGTTIINDL